MDYDDSGFKQRMKWAYRLAGVAAVAAFTWHLATEFDGSLGSLATAATVAFGVAFIAILLGLVIVFVLSVALGSSKDVKNPFVRVAYFVLAGLIGLGLLDLIVTQGAFILSPALNLVLSGDLQGTYWGCENWVANEGPGYCAD